MLQQTQVATVLPFFERWMVRFPDVTALANASTQEVLGAWQGLGYYRRARQLHEGAKQIAVTGWPQSAKEWRTVPGVGRYTAAAIASISLGEAISLVDGNVERVVARLTASRSTGSTLHREAWVWADQNLDTDHPATWNQALMELGATVCKPLNPRCEDCPISNSCAAFAVHIQRELPVAKIRSKTIAIQRTVWVPWHDNKVGLRQIQAGAWWEGLWEFPNVVTGQEASLKEQIGEVWPEHLLDFKHSVTHHRILISAYLVRCESPCSGLAWKKPEGLIDLPMPAPQRRIWKAAKTVIGV